MLLPTIFLCSYEGEPFRWILRFKHDLKLVFVCNNATLSITKETNNLWTPRYEKYERHERQKWGNYTVMHGSILPACYNAPPGLSRRGRFAIFLSYLVVYSPPPHTQKETISHTRDSTSTMDNMSFYVQNRTQNVKFFPKAKRNVFTGTGLWVTVAHHSALFWFIAHCKVYKHWLLACSVKNSKTLF